LAGPALRALGPGNSWLVGVVFWAQCVNRVGSLVKPSGAERAASTQSALTTPPTPPVPFGQLFGQLFGQFECTGEFQQVACLTDWRAACRLPGHKRRRSRREGSAPRRFGHSSRSSSATCIGFAPSRLSSSTRHEACCQTAPSALRLPLSTAPSGGFARRAGRARRCSYRLCTTSRSWQTRTSFPTSSSWSTWTITRLCRALRRRRCARRLRSSPFTRRLGTRTCSARAAPSARHRSSAWPPCTSAALGRRRGRRAGRSASGRATRTAVSTSLAAAPATCSPTSRPRARLRCSTWG